MVRPGWDPPPSGCRLLVKLLDLQAVIPVPEGLSQEQIDTALKREQRGQERRAGIPH
jgi:hypothetical protein